QFGLARDHQDRVLPRDRLQLHQVLAQAAFARIHDLLELSDDRLGGGVLHRVDADRLALQPVLVEGEHGVDGGPALAAVALDDVHLWGRTGALHAGFGGEPVDQLHYGRAGAIFQRPPRDAVAGFRVAGVDRAGAHRLGGRDEPVAAGIAHQHDVAYPERVL